MEEKKKLLAWIEKEVFKLDPNNPDPGRVTIRRLNRTEYQNSVYDLLGVEYDTREFSRRTTPDTASTTSARCCRCRRC